MAQSRQLMQTEGLLQGAIGLALGPRCSAQPGQAQLGPHPQSTDVGGPSGPVMLTDGIQGGNEDEEAALEEASLG